MEKFKTILQVIDALEQMKEKTGRFGSYETDMTNHIIDSLKEMEFVFTKEDMHLAFYKGSRILYDNNSTEYLNNYKKFMQDEYEIKV